MVLAYTQRDPNPGRLVPASDSLHGPRRGGAEYYRRTARKYVAPKGARAFLPLYREAERRWAVNWRLIASIHRQETAFSTAATTYHGLNDFGCCAGPMQFNVTNGPVSTWERHRKAFRRGRRPSQYPHRTRSHPSIYDDFDAIMAAGSLLSGLGAGPSLDERAWSAAYGYYGHDLYGITYASQVLARAAGWQRRGFCPNCGVDEGLVAKFDRAYGKAARKQLTGSRERPEKHEKQKPKKKKHKKKKHKNKRGERDRNRHKGKPDRSADRSPTGTRRKSKPNKHKPSPPRTGGDRTRPAAPAPTSPTPPVTTPQPTPTPPGRVCPPIATLLGCKP